MSITTTPTDGLPPFSGNKLNVKTNVFNPNTNKDEKIDISEFGGGPFDSIEFNPRTQAQEPYEIGKIFYDSDEKTWTAYNDIDGISLQLGEELRGRLINDTGVTILDGKAVSIIGAVGASLKVELLDASDQDSSIRGYGLMTITTINGAPGYAITYGAVRGLNTSGCVEGDIIYADPENKGEWTNVRPRAPYYPVRIGICLISDVSNGVIAVSTLAFNGSDTSVNIEGALNGIVLDTPNVIFSVSGGVIYADLTNEKYPARNLPFIFDGIRYDLDTLTNTGSGGAARVSIPPGTSTTLQSSLMYVYLNNGVPTFGVSTSEPNFPYARIGGVSVYDAARTTTEGKVFAYRRTNNTTDRIDGVHDGSYGLFEDILFWARTLGSSWLSGLDATPTVNNTTIRVALTAGTGRQFRRANLPAFDGLSYRIYNDVNNLSGNYPIVNNLTSITTTAGGTTDDLLSNNRFYIIKLYYQLNSNGIGNNIIATRPNGFYANAEDAIDDANNTATAFNDPLIEEVVFPIYDLVIGRTGSGGVNIALIQLTDRRSKLPFGQGGGGASGGGGVDEKVRISAADTTSDYLGAKVDASDGLVKEIVNTTGNEQINISGKNIPNLYWQFNNVVTDTDPGGGKFIIGSNFLNISISMFSDSGIDVSNFLNLINNGSSIIIQSRANSGLAKSLNVTGDAVDLTSYIRIPISIFDEDTAFVLDDIYGFDFIPDVPTLENVTKDVNNNNDVLISGLNYSLDSADGSFTNLLPVAGASARVQIYLDSSIDNDITISGNGANIEGSATWIAGSAQDKHLYEFVYNANDGEWKVRQLDSNVTDTSLLYWQFNTSTTDEDPTNGKFIIGADFINISYFAFAESGMNLTSFLLSIYGGANIVIQSRDGVPVSRSYKSTAKAILNATHVKIPVTLANQTGIFTGDNIYAFTFLQAGNSSGSSESVEKDPFTETIEIANLLQHSPNYTPTPGTTLNIVKGPASLFIGGTYQCVFTCDNNTFNFNASDFEEGTQDIYGATGRIWLIFALNPDGKLGVTRYGASTTIPQLIAPTILSVDSTSINSLTVNFSDANFLGLQSFTIQYDTVNTFDSANFGEMTGISPSKIEQLISGLLTSTLYYSRMKAIGNGVDYQDSLFSNIESQTTGAVIVSPTLTTETVTSISAIEAIGNGTLTNLGNHAPTAHGVVWSTSPNPTVSDSINDLGAVASIGSFTASITGLVDGTTYYVRAFATNSAGVGYGNEVSFIAEDEIVPSITGYQKNTDNLSVFVEFDTGVYGNDSASAPVLVSAFNINIISAGLLTGFTINSIEKTTGGSITGGESSIKINYTFTGAVNGDESISIGINSNSIYNAAGSSAPNTEVTDTIYLEKQGTPVDMTISSLPSTVDKVGTVYTLNSGSWDDGICLADENIPTNSNGYVQIDHPSATFAWIGFIPTNTPTVFTGIDDGARSNGGVLFRTVQGSSTNLGYNIPDGSIMRLRRSNGIAIIEVSEDNINYKVFNVSTFNTSAIRYCEFLIGQVGSAVTNPKILA